MASRQGRLTVTVRLPWWWKIYIEAARFCSDCGIDIDPDVCARFILEHTRYHIK